MARDATVHRADTVFALVETHEANILADVTANPGTTILEVAQRLTINERLVQQIMTIMVQSQVLVAQEDLSQPAVVKFWEPGAWSTLVSTNRAAIRAWVDANEGGKVSDMVAALGIPDALALVLLNYLRGETFYRAVAL
jgi:predicted transcriptional regulator